MSPTASISSEEFELASPAREITISGHSVSSAVLPTCACVLVWILYETDRDRERFVCWLLSITLAC